MSSFMFVVSLALTLNIILGAVASSFPIDNSGNELYSPHMTASALSSTAECANAPQPSQMQTPSSIAMAPPTQVKAKSSVSATALQPAPSSAATNQLRVVKFASVVHEPSSASLYQNTGSAPSSAVATSMGTGKTWQQTKSENEALGHWISTAAPTPLEVVTGAKHAPIMSSVFHKLASASSQTQPSVTMPSGGTAVRDSVAPNAHVNEPLTIVQFDTPVHEPSIKSLWQDINASDGTQAREGVTWHSSKAGDTALNSWTNFGADADTKASNVNTSNSNVKSPTITVSTPLPTQQNIVSPASVSNTPSGANSAASTYQKPQAQSVQTNVETPVTKTVNPIADAPNGNTTNVDASSALGKNANNAVGKNTTTNVDASSALGKNANNAVGKNTSNTASKSANRTESKETNNTPTNKTVGKDAGKDANAVSGLVSLRNEPLTETPAPSRKNVETVYNKNGARYSPASAYIAARQLLYPDLASLGVDDLHRFNGVELSEARRQQAISGASLFYQDGTPLQPKQLQNLVADTSKEVAEKALFEQAAEKSVRVGIQNNKTKALPANSTNEYTWQWQNRSNLSANGIDALSNNTSIPSTLSQENAADVQKQAVNSGLPNINSIPSVVQMNESPIAASRKLNQTQQPDISSISSIVQMHENTTAAARKLNQTQQANISSIPSVVQMHENTTAASRKLNQTQQSNISSIPSIVQMHENTTAAARKLNQTQQPDISSIPATVWMHENTIAGAAGAVQQPIQAQQPGVSSTPKSDWVNKNNTGGFQVQQPDINSIPATVWMHENTIAGAAGAVQQPGVSSTPQNDWVNNNTADGVQAVQQASPTQQSDFSSIPQATEPATVQEQNQPDQTGLNSISPDTLYKNTADGVKTVEDQAEQPVMSGNEAQTGVTPAEEGEQSDEGNGADEDQALTASEIRALREELSKVNEREARRERRREQRKKAWQNRRRRMKQRWLDNQKLWKAKREHRRQMKDLPAKLEELVGAIGSLKAKLPASNSTASNMDSLLPSNVSNPSDQQDALTDDVDDGDQSDQSAELPATQKSSSAPAMLNSTNDDEQEQESPIHSSAVFIEAKFSNVESNSAEYGQTPDQTSSASPDEGDKDEDASNKSSSSVSPETDKDEDTSDKSSSSASPDTDKDEDASDKSSSLASPEADKEEDASDESSSSASPEAGKDANASDESSSSASPEADNGEDASDQSSSSASPEAINDEGASDKKVGGDLQEPEEQDNEQNSAEKPDDSNVQLHKDELTPQEQRQESIEDGTASIPKDALFVDAEISDNETAVNEDDISIPQEAVFVEGDIAQNETAVNEDDISIPQEAVFVEGDIPQNETAVNEDDSSIPQEAVFVEGDMAQNETAENEDDSSIPQEAVFVEGDIAQNETAVNEDDSFISQEAVFVEGDIAENETAVNEDDISIPQESVFVEGDIAGNETAVNKDDSFVPKEAVFVEGDIAGNETAVVNSIPKDVAFVEGDIAGNETAVNEDDNSIPKDVAFVEGDIADDKTELVDSVHKDAVFVEAEISDRAEENAGEIADAASPKQAAIPSNTNDDIEKPLRATPEDAQVASGMSDNSAFPAVPTDSSTPVEKEIPSVPHFMDDEVSEANTSEKPEDTDNDAENVSPEDAAIARALADVIGKQASDDDAVKAPKSGRNLFAGKSTTPENEAEDKLDDDEADPNATKSTADELLTAPEKPTQEKSFINNLKNILGFSPTRKQERYERSAARDLYRHRKLSP